MSEPTPKTPTPIVASRRPAILTLEPGSYYWCTCGKSQSQPFCDGSHWGSAFFPQPFDVTETTRIALCNCKHSGDGHRCDGAHRHLPDDSNNPERP